MGAAELGPAERGGSRCRPRPAPSPWCLPGMGRHLRSAGLGSAGVSCPGRDVTLGCADAEHLCSAPHPPPGTPSRQRTRLGVCLFSFVDFPALRAEAAAGQGGKVPPPLREGSRFPLPCSRRSGHSASPSARRLCPVPACPGPGPALPAALPEGAGAVSALGDDDDSSGLPQEAVPGLLGRGVPRKRCKKLLGNHCHVKSRRVQEQLQDTS